MNATKSAGLLFAALFLSAAPWAQAQQYPSRPIRLIIPWPPGGITDVISRGLGIMLTESLGQQVIPDNRPGAAGTVGVSIAAKANADGYTMLMTDVPSHAISASLYTKLTYNPLKDIEPVALPSRSPLVLVVAPKYGIKTTAQLIEYAKARPGSGRGEGELAGASGSTATPGSSRCTCPTREAVRPRPPWSGEKPGCISRAFPPPSRTSRPEG